MSGLAEILDQNTALRRQLQEQTELLRVQTELLRAQTEQLIEKDTLIDGLNVKMQSIERKFTRLEEQMMLIEKRRELAKAERFIAAEAQAMLFPDADVQVPARDPELEAEDEGKPDEPSDGRRKSVANGGHRRKGRRKLSAEDIKLPKTIVFSPAGDVPGGQVVGSSTTTSWRVDYNPGFFTLIENVREQKRRADGTVWTAPEPFLLPGAMCGDGLLAHVVINKFEDHIPLNRQAKRLTRRGMTFGTNVLANWVRKGSEQVRLLVGAIRRQVAEDQLILSDDTGLPVQDGANGKLRKGRLWVFTDQRQAFYAFSPDKKGERPKDILTTLGFDGGVLVADGGSEYNAAEADLNLTRGGCWAHFRRYFTNAAVLHDKAEFVLPAFQDLFMIERQLADLDPDDRLAARQERSVPLVDGIYRFIEEVGPTVRPASPLATACGYGLSQRSRMRLFLTDGRVPLHNNLSELLLRQAVIGRKNWMFARSAGGADAAADWYTLIASAKLQGLNPGAYLYDVFKRLPSYSSTRVGDLTPLNWRLAVEAGTLNPLKWGEFPDS